MPPAVAAIGAAVTSFVGAYVSTTLGIGLATLGATAVGIGTIIAGGILANKVISSLYEMPQIENDASRQRTAKGTIEPMKIIYGETLVSGPLSFIGTSGDKNDILWHSVVLAGHEVNAITDIYFDNEVITSSNINGDGFVTTGTFGPKSTKVFFADFSTYICKINKHLGGAGQTVDADLDQYFASIGTNHKGTGLAYIVTAWFLNKGSQETWDQYSPQNIKALVQGRKVYDYRLDDELIKPNVSNPDFIAYSTNPVWCLIDYLINTDFGMKVNPSKIDWEAAAVAADACDVLVSVPGGTEKRFTCNGVLFGTDSHKTNINKIISAMNGMMTYTNGKFVIRAGVYEAPTVSLNENHLQAGLSLKTSVERSDRFNTVTGTFIDPDQNYKSVEMQQVQIAAALARDNNEVLTKEIQLPMTNSQCMAQRIGYKLIKQSDLQKVVTFPANLAGVQVAVGSRVNLSIEELGWTNKVFICLGWSFSDSGNGGVNLTLREDNADAYADPALGDYNAPSTTNTLPNSFYSVPAPEGLIATGGIQNITLEWDNPDMISVLYVEVYASADSSWTNAQLIGSTNGTQFTHSGSNKVDPIASGDTRYYWVRARAYDFGNNAQALSPRFPDSDTSTVIATVGQVPASTGLSVSANAVYGFDSGPSISGSVTSGAAVVTASGGTTPYTYAWTHISTTTGNTPTISSSSISNPTFSATVFDGVQSSSTWQVSVTDGASDVATAYVSVTLIWFDSSGGIIP